ncbi:elongation factor Ts, mitochondrial-like [Pomacea canaliculata]|nr:elongation factor Ts, mitochondrial-like [Pomacea canaliculata]
MPLNMWSLVFQRMPVSCLWSSTLRTMSTGVDKTLLNKLRKRTGYTLINCKKALERCGNDLEDAEKWLHEQAQKEGWCKATKLQTRCMSQGLIGIVNDCKAATMVEVNCETDFVARNCKFIDLTSQVAHACHHFFLKQKLPMIFANRGMVNSIPAPQGCNTLADIVALCIGSVGENMVLRRAVHLKEEKSSISSYVHTSCPEINACNNCCLGKYGVLMSLQHDGKCHERDECNPYSGLSLDKVSNVLGQHIVGMNPKIIGYVNPDNSCNRAPRTCQEDEDDSCNRPTRSCPDREENKCEEPPRRECKEPEEDRLLFQEFLLDQNISVGDMLKKNGVTVKAFARFACGEALPDD